MLTQAVGALEGTHGGLGGGADSCRSRRRPGEAGAAEATLEVADGLAVLPGGQWAETRNSSSSCSSWVLPIAPTSFLLISPPENTSIVGMLITL